MDNLPFFSVIIPTFNRPVQLANCLQALTLQDYPSERFEVIVVDDGGELSLEKVQYRFKDRLHLSVIRQANIGPAAARNRGASLARGRYLAFTDDDCDPDTEWLTSLSEGFMKMPESMIGGRTINRLTDNIYSSASQLIIDAVYAYYNVDHNKAHFFASNNMALPARSFLKIGGYDGVRFPETSEDRDLCDRWLNAGYSLIYISEAIVGHSHSLSFLSFCRQQFHYGQGAARFHRALRQRQTSHNQTTFHFHLNLKNWLFHPFKTQTGWQALNLALLLLVWQVVNFTGFCYKTICRFRESQADS